MRKFIDVDIVECLKGIFDETTEKHQMDFKFDIMRIYSEAHKAKDDGITRHLLWMAKKNGTWCVLEANVYIREAYENKIWCGYQHEPEGVAAFAVEITGVRDNTAIGNVYEIIYMEHVAQIPRHLFDACSVNIELINGEKMNVPIDQFNFYKLQLEHNTIKKITYLLANAQGHHEFLTEVRSLRNA
jgi:hypothetical protein